MTDERYIFRNENADYEGESVRCRHECVSNALDESCPLPVTIYRMVPIGRVTPAVQWFDEPVEQAAEKPWYPDDGPWEELTGAVRERLRTTDRCDNFEFLFRDERKNRSYIKDSEKGRGLFSHSFIVAVKRAI